jgi:defect-in-organelle-trafficking protein DotC
VNILPPVLLKANNYILDEGGRAIVISKHHYRLYSQAKLVTVVPSWSDYLISSIPAPKPVVKAYLPHNDNEKVVWSSGIQHGWLLGIKQANQEMDYRINRLNRDYNGMITYLKLLDEGKVSAPYIAYTHQSVIGNNEAMSVNQNVYRITSNAKLVVNPKNWKFVSQEKI